MSTLPPWAISILILFYTFTAVAATDLRDTDTTTYDDDSPVRARSPVESQFVGTNLLHLDTGRTRCFAHDDVALLVARKEYERLLPNISSALHLATDRSVPAMLEFFRGTLAMVGETAGPTTRPVCSVALCDTIGGYMRYVYVPLVRLSFYAGNVDYTNTAAVFGMHAWIERRLNTRGNGWRRPRAEWFRAQRFAVEPIDIQRNTSGGVPKAVDVDRQPCASLIESAEQPDDANRMLVALPRLQQPTSGNGAALEAIWLPLKRQRTYNLASKHSAFVLLRYYVAVVECYAFRGASPLKFNRRFGDWLADRILPYVNDADAAGFYPGLGAILRVAQTLHLQHDGRAKQTDGDATATGDQAFARVEQEVRSILKSRRDAGLFDRMWTRLGAKTAASSCMKEHLNMVTALGLVGCVAVIVLALMWCACAVVRRRRQSRSNAVPPIKPRAGWCARNFRRLRRSRRPDADDEEIDCPPDSPSVMRSQSAEQVLRITELNGKPP